MEVPGRVFADSRDTLAYSSNRPGLDVFDPLRVTSVVLRIFALSASSAFRCTFIIFSHGFPGFESLLVLVTWKGRWHFVYQVDLSGCCHPCIYIGSTIKWTTMSHLQGSSVLKSNLNLNGVKCTQISIQFQKFQVV